VADKFCKRLIDLHARLGSPNAHEREAAWYKLDKLLKKEGKSWNDLPGILSGANNGPPRAADADIDDAVAPSDISALDLIHHLLGRYLYLTPYEYVAMALWIVHTHVYSRFIVTPRVALTSPVRGCGKTSALSLISSLAAKAEKFDHATPATLFRLIDQQHPTLLLDEGDNLDLLTNGILRAVLNSGHRRDGKITRYINETVVKFSTFAPVALAVIGSLPLPLMHRSIVIRMERAPETATLTRFDELNPDIMHDCSTVHREVMRWARQCTLDLDPPIPTELRNRAADNWRVLLSIADAFGSEWGKRAREAAVAMSKTHQDEDFAVLLLSDIRDIFNRHPTVDRLASAVVVAELCELPDGIWSEWRGLKEDQVPRRFTQGNLALLLRPFSIRPKTIWPARRGMNDKAAKGYYRQQFEKAWAAYCAGTSAQASKVRYLRGASSA